jgi:hypothetical protein
VSDPTGHVGGLASWALTIRRDRKGLLGAWLLGTFVLVAIAGPWFVGDPSALVGIPLQPPSFAHPLGTNGQGQDGLAQLVVGTRVSLALGFAVGLAVVLLGALVGVPGGYFGKRTDATLSILSNGRLRHGRRRLGATERTGAPHGATESVRRLYPDRLFRLAERRGGAERLRRRRSPNGSPVPRRGGARILLGDVGRPILRRTRRPGRDLSVCAEDGRGQQGDEHRSHSLTEARGAPSLGLATLYRYRNFGSRFSLNAS